MFPLDGAGGYRARGGGASLKDEKRSLEGWEREVSARGAAGFHARGAVRGREVSTLISLFE